VENGKLKVENLVTIEYDLSEQDYINLNLYHAEHSKQGKKTAWMMKLGIPLLTFIVFVVFARHNVFDFGTAWTIGLGVVVAIAGVFLYPKLLQQIVSSSLRRAMSEGKCSFIGPWKLTLQEDCIEEVSANTTAYTKYSAVEKVGCGYDSLFVYIGAIQALVIPLSAFASDEQRDEFLAILKSKTGLSASDLP